MPEAREWFCPRPAALPERCSAIGVVARRFPEGADQWEEVALLIELECDRDFTPSIHMFVRTRIFGRFEFYLLRNLDRLLCKPVRQSLDDVNMPYFAV